MNNKKQIIIGLSILVVLIIIVVAIKNSSNNGDNGNFTQESYEKTLSQKLSKVNVQTIPATKSAVKEELSEAEELPDINNYPIRVKGNGQIDVEVFSSPEKAGDSTDAWFNEIAKKFNAEGHTINGKTVSISVRKIDSGLGMDYIKTGKYVPAGYSPSNELWGKMLEAKKINITLKTDRLVGNTAGILLKKDAYQKIQDKYGSVDLKSVVQATTNGDISMGYTNPLASSSGLNFILSTLYSYNSNDPFSDDAINGFLQFQQKIDLMAQTTMQLRTSAVGGSLDGIIIESQSLKNLPELSGFVYTPYGVRHDEPLYSLTEDSEKNQVLDLFVQYCKKSDSQNIASQYGFNEYDDYKSNIKDFSGEEIIRAQSLWKENKDSGNNISAVFVADISGSMQGEPLNNLKTSLINGAKYINKNNSIGLVSYNSAVYKNLDIAKFDITQRSYFQGAVENLSGSGSTASYDAVLEAMQMLQEEKQKNPNNKLMIFLLSDGEQNTGYSLNDITDLVKYSQIPIYSIGYNANISALKQISDINEAASIDASSSDVIYQLKQLFNAQM